MKKTTQNLLDMMKNSKDYQEYLKEAGENVQNSCMKIDRALHALLAEKKLTKAEVIAKSGIETHYAYQIFSGIKTPTRDKVIMLCFGLGLEVSETQRLLKITGYATLYGKEARDNAILFGFIKRLSVIEVNEILYELHLDLLI